MRTLNRPMFRYGGPIKEGVMDGIREPKRNGGTMGTHAALVGNPVFPTTNGRAHHEINYRFNPIETVKDIKKAKSNIVVGGIKKGVRQYAPGLEGIGGKTLNKLRNFYNKNIQTMPKLRRTDTSSPVGLRGGLDSSKVSQNSLLDRIKYFGRQNPKTTVGGAYVASPAVVGAATSFPYEKAVKQVGDLLVPDFIFDQDKYYEDKNKVSNKIEKKTKRTPEQIEADKIIAAEKSRLSGIAKEEFAEKEKEKRIANYRKIMDIEGMNKDAAYNSLISTSQLINQEGDFKGSIKDGSLINKIIGATSKNFDKPKQTKDAINTLILKNQMAADTPSTALKDLVALGIDTPEKQEMYLRTKMGLPANMGAARAAAQKSGSIGANITKDAAKMMYPGDYKGDILDKETFTERFESEIEKGEGRPNEIITAIISGEAQGKDYPPGKYTVGDVLVEVDENFNVTIIQ